LNVHLLMKSTLVAVLILAVLAPTAPKVTYAASGTWRHTEPNSTGNSDYEVYYSVPERILTNVSNTITVSMNVLRLGGTTYRIVTDSVKVSITATGGEYATTRKDTESLVEGQRWGPLEIPITIVDSDFKLNPQGIINAKIHIILSFGEIGQVCILGSCSDIPGSPFSKEIDSDKDGLNINTVVQSTAPVTPQSTIMDLLDRYWSYVVAGVGLTVFFFVVITVRGKWGSITIGAGRRAWSNVT
jgi:hypothetical protein